MMSYFDYYRIKLSYFGIRRVLDERNLSAQKDFGGIFGNLQNTGWCMVPITLRVALYSGHYSMRHSMTVGDLIHFQLLTM